MKIAHLLCSDKYSGAENVVCQIIEWFKKDHEIEMVYVSKEGPIRHIVERKNILFYGLGNCFLKDFFHFVKTQQPTIVHAHDIRASCVAALVKIIFPKIKIISHLHKNDPSFSYLSTKLVIYSLLCKNFDTVLCVSKSIKDEFLFKSLSNKFIVINNPIDINKIRRLGGGYIDENINYDIGFVGRFSAEKNPEEFVNIVKQLIEYKKDLKACMIGNGELFDYIKTCIVKYNLDKNINLFGFLENPLPYMKRIKLLCVPSKWEGYGLVCIEAMALGVPVLCSGVGGMKNLVTEMSGKICHNTNEYVNEIIILLKDHNKLNNKKNNSLKKSNEFNNIARYMDDIRKYYFL